jgi:hypothetical protein
MNEFIHPNAHTHCLILTIITKKRQDIQEGETFCHVKLTPLKDVLVESWLHPY